MKSQSHYENVYEIKKYKVFLGGEGGVVTLQGKWFLFFL